MIESKQTESTDGQTPPPPKDSNSLLKLVAAGLAIATVALLVSTIVLAVENADLRDSPSKAKVVPLSKEVEVAVFAADKPPALENPCAGAKPDLENLQCMIDGVVQAIEQAGANVTKGYQGGKNASAVPIDVPYYQVGLCPVNVHWHLGAEHYSLGEFDETGTGPTPIDGDHHDDEDHHDDDHRVLAGEIRQGFQCKHYDETDPKFTTPYNWKHCDKSMEVGQTYEVHWPHSAAGDCGTIHQYQSPFYDGVFCNLPPDQIPSLTPQDIANAVGVQGQVFTIVNDESYYYPDLIRGMIKNDVDMGVDIAIYTGSTTGTTRDNDICSAYGPITWHVDRKCHLISASSFDKMCADMKSQNDDMSEDLHAHGSRELVANHLAANNHQGRLRKN